MKYIPISFFLPSEPCSTEATETQIIVMIVLIIAILVIVALIIKQFSELK